jgi:hypothetical protein
MTEDEVRALAAAAGIEVLEERLAEVAEVLESVRSGVTELERAGLGKEEPGEWAIRPT